MILKTWTTSPLLKMTRGRLFWQLYKKKREKGSIMIIAIYSMSYNIITIPEITDYVTKGSTANVPVS